MIRFSLFLAMLSPLPVFAMDLPKADAKFATPDIAKAELGQLLFYDPVLSGNRTVSCATCHHPRFGTSDGVSLGIGDGGVGLGPDRVAAPDNPPEQRIPRNAPALFNLGASEFTVFFHDGRLEADTSFPNGIRTPLGQDMAAGFDSALSAQAMFPVLSGDEMAGHYSENEISQAVRLGTLSGPDGAWDRLSARVAGIPEYRRRFDQVIGADKDIHFTDIANAIAAFIEIEWRADDSPFDRYLRTGAPLPDKAMDGMVLFYGDAGCNQCHTGQFQTDHGFHAIAMPQIGPGKAARFERHHRDVGRMRVTGNANDAYRFRTPSLRNIYDTAPYGHSGAFAALEDVIRHHLAPRASLEGYDISKALLPELSATPDTWVLDNDSELAAIAQASTLAPKELSDEDIRALMAFLATLTDTQSLAGRMGIPETVPSGLDVDQ